MFRFFNETKPGRRKNEPTSMLETTMARAESLLHKDIQKGLSYLRQAHQQYNQLNTETPGFLEIEYWLERLYVDYYKKQAGII
ncbi:MAG: hypothetical protein AABX31_02245 [Nanoarchaeota archaeon]